MHYIIQYATTANQITDISTLQPSHYLVPLPAGYAGGYSATSGSCRISKKLHPVNRYSCKLWRATWSITNLRTQKLLMELFPRSIFVEEFTA